MIVERHEDGSVRLMDLDINFHHPVDEYVHRMRGVMADCQPGYLDQRKALATRKPGSVSRAMIP